LHEVPRDTCDRRCGRFHADPEPSSGEHVHDADLVDVYRTVSEAVFGKLATRSTVKPTLLGYAVAHSPVSLVPRGSQLSLASRKGRYTSKLLTKVLHYE